MFKRLVSLGFFAVWISRRRSIAPFAEYGFCRAGIPGNDSGADEKRHITEGAAW